MTSLANKKMSNSDLRKFGLVTAVMLLLFFDLLIPWIWKIDLPIWPVYAAGVLTLMALAWPASLGPVYRVWMRFAEALGWVNTRIILGLFFSPLVLILFLLPFLCESPVDQPDYMVGTKKIW